MAKALLIACTVLLTAACTAPLAPEIRDRIDPGLGFAAVAADPQRYQGQVLMLGGSIVALRDDDSGGSLELLRWEVTRWGEPLALSASADRLVVRSRQPLDPDLYTPGRLVTLAAVVDGTVTIVVGDHRETVPAFNLLHIHLWDTPFRYGLHPNPDPGQPEYITPVDPGPSHPYDPTPWSYPFAPHWYRTH